MPTVKAGTVNVRRNLEKEEQTKLIACALYVLKNKAVLICGFMQDSHPALPLDTQS